MTTSRYYQMSKDQFQEAIRVLNNIKPEQLTEIMGTDHFTKNWFKDDGLDVVGFICSLDNDYLEVFYDYILEWK